MTVIKRCKCSHEYQDKEYGKSLRVFNLCKRGEGYFTGRCTVCGEEKRWQK